MAYNVTQDYRNKCYSGTSMYRARLIINENEVPNTQIKNIKISSPIIDKTSDTFYIGSFISQQLTITFKNLDGLDIQSGYEVSVEIGQFVNGEYEYCPIGKYLIDDLAENYYTTCQIVCLDYGVKFKECINYMNDGESVETFSTTIDDILQRICNIVGVELGDYPTTNGDVITGHVNNETSGKQYISWIAEMKGCNAKIGRDGKLYLIPIKRPKTVTINALKSKAWELGEEFKIDKLTYFNGGQEATYPLNDEIEEEDTGRVIIRQDNPFISGTQQDVENIVSEIYEVVKDLSIWNVKNENFGDVSLDCWDIIEFTLGEKTYLTYNNNEITYEQSIMTKIETKMPSKQQQVATNVFGDGLEAFKRITQVTVDQQNQKITQTIERVNGQESKFVEIETSLDGTKSTIKENSDRITEMNTTINGLSLNITKTGNNLFRNTMFYDFEGWSTLAPFEITKSDTPPTGNIYATYWYCTQSNGIYEKGVMYKRSALGTENYEWEKTNILISDLERSFPIPYIYNVISNEQTRQKYISGRSLNAIYDKSSEEISKDKAIYGDRFDILDTEDELTLSFKATTNFKNGGDIDIRINVVEDDKESANYFYDTFLNFSINKNVTNRLFKYKFKIPRSRNAINVYSSDIEIDDTPPTDTSVLWLQLLSMDDTYRGSLYQYNGETWENIHILSMMKDQNNRLYFPSALITPQEDTEELNIRCYYWGMTNGEDWLTNFSAKIGYPTIDVDTYKENSVCDIELSDLKLEYGEYSEWSPKRTEVVGTNHLLDETGYKITSGDDEMRLMIDELAQYYKDEKTFYINKSDVYSKNAKSLTSDVDGLITISMNTNNGKIYGRYIR